MKTARRKQVTRKTVKPVSATPIVDKLMNREPVSASAVIDGLNPATRRFLGLQEVADRWGISIFTVRRLIEKKDVRAINIGARIMVSLAEIERVEVAGAGARRARNGGTVTA